MQSILGYRVQELFDPIQTHAAYNVPRSQVDKVKEVLREQGATRFRLVKPQVEGVVIVCFKLK